MKNNPFSAPVPSSEILNRIRALKTRMEKTSTDAVFLTHKPDLFYFSGTAQDAYLYVPKDHDPLLFVKQYLPRAMAETGINQVIQVESITRIPGQIRSLHGRLPASLGLALDVVPVRDFQFFETLFNPAVMTDATALIMGCRMIKSDWEIDQMAVAAGLSSDTFSFVRLHMTPDESEIAFCGRVEAFARAHGHSGKLLVRHYRAEGFSHHLMSGVSGGMAGALDSPMCGTGTCSAYPYGAGHKLIQRNEPILLDLGTMVNGYHMDETRMLVMGTFPPDAEQAGQAAIDILYHVLEKMKPGVPAGEVFTAAVNRAEKLGLAGPFLGLPGLKSRFIGHGVGLELVEPPILSKDNPQELMPGMVFAVEPKFIFKDRFAAGIESVIQVTDTGARFLSVTENRMFIL
jgi:Xaa-Pro aminopeptidase